MKRFSSLFIPLILAFLLGFGRLGVDIVGYLTDDGENRIAPVITTDTTSIRVCPISGRIQPFAYTVTDNRDGDIADRTETILDGDTYTIRVKDSDGNHTRIILPVEYIDNEAPVITLTSEASYSIYVGDSLEISDPTVSDNCDDVSLEKFGSFDVNTPGTYELKFSATDASGNTAEKTISIEVKEKPKNSGVIYLTFDDGPGPYTDRLLDVLKKYGVKVTFFVTSSGSDETIRRAYDEGHTIGLHTSSHDYGYIYASVHNYFTDLEYIQARVERITGYHSMLIRFPGGSSNMVSSFNPGIMSTLVGEVTSRGYTYFDWNVSSGDAGGAYTSDQVYWNTVNSLYPDGRFVVLQHDIKDFSVDAVERIIQYGLANGYTFSGLDAHSPTMHHRVNN